MNFSFWPEKETEQCEVTYKGTTYTGYMTLCASITRAMEEGEQNVAEQMCQSKTVDHFNQQALPITVRWACSYDLRSVFMKK